MTSRNSHDHFVTLNAEKPVISGSYPRSLCGASHDHFVALDSQKETKTTITLWRKPIVLKNPISLPVVADQNLWTTQKKSKKDAPNGATYRKAGLRQQKQKQKSRRGAAFRSTAETHLHRAWHGLGEAYAPAVRANLSKNVPGPRSGYGQSVSIRTEPE